LVYYEIFNLDFSDLNVIKKSSKIEDLVIKYKI
jgi:hypothetical protein